MAVYLSNGVQVTVNSVDLSTYVSSVTLNRTVDALEVTAMGDSGHRYVAGLEANSVTIDFFNDWATGKVGQTLDTVFKTNTTVTVQPASGAVSATNPKYTFTAFVDSVTPVNGAVGDLATQSVTWQISGVVEKTTS